MDRKQKAAFNAAIIDEIIARGTPADPSPSIYDWEHRKGEVLRMHITGCRPDYANCSWADSQWQEWQGTFEPVALASGIDAVVNCRCGITVRDVTWRYALTYAELIQAITS